MPMTRANDGFTYKNTPLRRVLAIQTDELGMVLLYIA